MPYTGEVEYAEQRKVRSFNKRYYRVLHWPIWIWVFFLAPGPLTFSLFASGFHLGNTIWMAVVLLCTGFAGLYGQLPGSEPRPYILKFNEDKPNPLYRRVCYTFAWNALLNFMLLNLAGLAIALMTGTWYLHQIYTYAYYPICMTILLLGLAGKLPRAGKSTKGEGIERRYFYGAVWSITAAQTVLLILWKILPRSYTCDWVKLAVYVAVMAFMGWFAFCGKLPRTRPIMPGEMMISD